MVPKIGEHVFFEASNTNSENLRCWIQRRQFPSCLLPHLLGKAFIQICSVSDNSLPIPPKKTCQQSRAQLAQACQLSEQWIPVVSQVSRALEHAHGFARVHRRVGLSKASDSNKALKAPLILNYLAISDENGCGILIFC